MNNQREVDVSWVETARYAYVGTERKEIAMSDDTEFMAQYDLKPIDATGDYVHEAWVAPRQLTDKEVGEVTDRLARRWNVPMISTFYKAPWWRSRRTHEIAVTILSITTTVTLASKHILVFYPLALASSLLFGWFCWRKRQYGILVTTLASFAVNVVGFLNWSGVWKW